MSKAPTIKIGKNASKLLTRLHHVNQRIALLEKIDHCLPPKKHKAFRELLRPLYAEQAKLTVNIKSAFAARKPEKAKS